MARWLRRSAATARTSWQLLHPLMEARCSRAGPTPKSPSSGACQQSKVDYHLASAPPSVGAPALTLKAPFTMFLAP